MRYCIKANLSVKLESSLLLPGTVDFQIGAVLIDDATNLFNSLHGAVQPLGVSTEKKLESLPHKKQLFELL